MDEKQLRINQQRRIEYRRRRQAQRRRKNRIIMVTVSVLLLALLIWVIAALVGSCSSVNANTNAATAPTSATKAAPTQPPTDSIKPVKDNGKDGVITDSGIYLWDNKGFELFSGSEESAQNYAKAISSYKKQLGSGITVYNMVVPGHVEFGLPDRLLKDIPSSSQRNNMDNIFKNYTEDVKAVDIYDALNKHKTEYLYFNTDHHWTGLGAYYAYTAFADVAGFKPVELSKLTSHKITGFTGSLYLATEAEELKKNEDFVVYYDIPGNYTTKVLTVGATEFVEVGDLNYGDAEGGNAYSAFLWGDNAITEIKHTDKNTGKNILVVKESYGNAFIPFLVNDYDEVHVIDFRHYEGNLKEYCTKNNIKEVLFLNGIMSANNAMQISAMDTLFTP